MVFNKMSNRFQGEGLSKKQWYSICSAHREYEKDCPRCNAGTWVNIHEQKIWHVFFSLCPSFWRILVNRQFKWSFLERKYLLWWGKL